MEEEMMGQQAQPPVDAQNNNVDSRYGFQKYTIRRKVFTFLGAKFHIYGPDGQLVFFSKQKAFKLKEDIRLYSDESMQTEVLSIQARQIMDFSVAYDIFDPIQGVKVGALKRKGWSSMIQDSWIIMDGNDQEIGKISEDSTLLALLRRFVVNLIPQSFIGEARGQQVFRFSQRFNPFVLKIDLDFSTDTTNLLDRRIGIAAATLLCAIESRQN